MILRNLLQRITAIILAGFPLFGAVAHAEPFLLDQADPANGLIDIFSTTFDGALGGVPPGDPFEFFFGRPGPDRAITFVPNPTGYIDTSEVDVTLSQGNTQATLSGGTFTSPDLQLMISSPLFPGPTTVLTASNTNPTNTPVGWTLINFSPITVPIDANGVAVFELEASPTIVGDFSAFADIVDFDNGCSGPLCALVGVLTLDMVRFRVTLDFDPTFTSFEGAYIGQTANNSLVFATLNSVVPTPDITVTDSVAPVDDQQIPFGDAIEATSVDETVTVTNDGDAGLVLGQITQPAAPFSVLNDMCSNQTLAPAASCALTVRFEPNTTGVFNSSFDIPSNDPDENPVTVDVGGTGVAPAITVIDSVPPANDLQIPFGDVTVNPPTPPDETITVTNSGTANLTIGQVIQPSVPFSVLNDTCSNQVLIPAANCTVTVRFEPATPDPFNSSLGIPSNDPNSAITTVNVSGTGTATILPRISLANAPVLFGDVPVGTSADETVTVTNDGAADLTVGQITQPAAPFSVLNDVCSDQTLAAAADCTVTVRFNPAAAGLFADSFGIPSNDPNTATAIVNVSGTGVVPEITVTDSVDPIDDLLIPFGNVIATMMSVETVTATNSGVVDLTLGQATIADPAGPFSILNDNCAAPQNVIAPGNSCTIDVQFSPASVGTFTGSLDIPSNDPNMATATVMLDGSGTGSAPDIAVTDPVPPADDLLMPFGNVTEASAWAQAVTITNEGNGNLVMGQIAQADPLENTFSILSDNCSAQIIAPADSCAVEVRFLPTRVDGFTDSFDIPSNDPDEPNLTFTVTGSGVAVGTGTISLIPEGADSGFFGSALRPATVLALLGLVAANLRRRKHSEGLIASSDGTTRR